MAGHLGYRNASLAVAEEGFSKKGSDSAGVSRQYCSTSCRIDNCQIDMFLLHWDTTGNTVPIDCELLLPPRWAENPVARRHAGIPDERHRVSREATGLAMIGRALDSGMPPAG